MTLHAGELFPNAQRARHYGTPPPDTSIEMTRSVAVAAPGPNVPDSSADPATGGPARRHWRERLMRAVTQKIRAAPTSAEGGRAPTRP
jgi:hypothetical protein